VKKAGAGLDGWTALGADLQTTREQLNGLLARLDNLAFGLEQGKGAAGKLLNETVLVDDAEKLLAQAGQTLGQLQGMVTNLNLAAMDVQTGAARLPEIADAVANETKELPGLVVQTQTSMRELERLIEALQRHWLVRKYVDKTNPAALGRASELEPTPQNRKPQTPPKGTR